MQRSFVVGAHEFYYLFWLNFPPEKKKKGALLLILAQRQKSEGKAWDEKEGKTFPSLERRIMRTLLCLKRKIRSRVESWNVDCGWKREGNEARENVEHDYRLGWGRKIQRRDKASEGDAMPYLNFPSCCTPAAAACTLKTNIICSGLVTRSLHISPDWASVHMLEKQTAVLW